MQLNVMQCIVALSHGGAEQLALTILGKGFDGIHGRVCGLVCGTGSLIPEMERLSLPYDVLCSNKISRFSATRTLLNILKQNSIDVLHVQAAYLLSFVLPAALLTGTRIVYTEHAKYSMETKPLLRHAVRLAAPFLHTITCVSQDLKNFMVDRVGIRAEKILVIPSGVDTNKFSSSVSSDDHSLIPASWDRSKCFVFGNVARFTDAKDHPNLLYAFNEVRKIWPEVRLIMVGDGESRLEVEELIRKLNLNSHVHLAGMRNDIPQVLRALNAFVLSSKREGMPISVLEAMASGLPVITTDVGGIREVVTDGVTARIVPPRDRDALSRAMCWMLELPDARAELAAKGEALVRARYGRDVMVGRYMRLYTQSRMRA